MRELILNTFQQLDINQMLDRITVQRPYFAFTKLTMDEREGIHGEFIAEQPTCSERGPITAAEIGRHLAILGLVAATQSSMTPDRAYHLATRAQFRRIRYPGSDPNLSAYAKVVSSERRRLIAEAIVSDLTPFVTLQVEYVVLTESIFRRLFGEQRVESSEVIKESPYIRAIELELASCTQDEVCAWSQPIRPSQCAGHFPMYPAWPVAVVMHTLVRVAEALLHRAVGMHVVYDVTRAAVVAERLAFACEPLRFTARIDLAHSKPPLYRFWCEASSDSGLVATLDVDLVVAPNSAMDHDA